MDNNSSNTLYSKKKIAKNTLVLYVQMFVTILVQLYVVPVLLRSLGVEDYGIYNVVAGIVTMFTFVSGSLTSAAQRFMAYSIGQGDNATLRDVFSSTFLIYLIIALFLCFILEPLGIWFLNTQMEIPVKRLNAANWVFHFTLFFFVVEIMIIPFRAVIIAHERMNIMAYLTISECILKLGAAIVITFVTFDRLIAYSGLLSVVAVIILMTYWLYCKLHFKECQTFSFRWNRDTGKSLLAYSGWNMIGLLAMILRNQGLNVVQNIFFGPVVNAAHSIAQQVQGVVGRFVDNVYVASRPQITKLYAANQKDKMWELIFQSAKLAFFLMMLICVPAILELDTVLKVWLHDVPPYTAVIAKLMMLSLLIETLVNQIIAAYQAANKIKRYQIFASSILLLNIPISYIVLKMNPHIPQIPYIVSVLLSVVYIISILWIAKKEVELDVKQFLSKVLGKNIIVFSISFVMVYYACGLLNPSLWRIIYTVIVSTMVSGILIWTIGLDNNERQYAIKLIKNKIVKK